MIAEESDRRSQVTWQGGSFGGKPGGLEAGQLRHRHRDCRVCRAQWKPSCGPFCDLSRSMLFELVFFVCFFFLELLWSVLPEPLLLYLLAFVVDNNNSPPVCVYMHVCCRVCGVAR